MENDTQLRQVQSMQSMQLELKESELYIIETALRLLLNTSKEYGRDKCEVKSALELLRKIQEI